MNSRVRKSWTPLSPVHNEQLNCLNSLWVILSVQRLEKKLTAISSIQSHFFWSFIVPSLDLSSDEVGRDQKDFDTREKNHSGNYIWLVALHETYVSPAELEAVNSDLRCKCCTKRKAKGEGTENDVRVSCLYSSCSSSWVSSGFTAGCLKKVPPC